MMNEHQVSTNAGGNKKKGITRFSIGVVLLVIGIVCFIASFNFDEWGLPVFVISISGIAAGSIYVVTGVTLFFVRKSAKGEQLRGIILFSIVRPAGIRVFR